MGHADPANDPVPRPRLGTDRDLRRHAGDERHGTDPRHRPVGARRGARAHRFGRPAGPADRADVPVHAHSRDRLAQRDAEERSRRRAGRVDPVGPVRPGIRGAGCAGIDARPVQHGGSCDRKSLCTAAWSGAGFDRKREETRPERARFAAGGAKLVSDRVSVNARIGCGPGADRAGLARFGGRPARMLASIRRMP